MHLMKLRWMSFKLKMPLIIHSLLNSSSNLASSSEFNVFIDASFSSSWVCSRTSISKAIQYTIAANSKLTITLRSTSLDLFEDLEYNNDNPEMCLENTDAAPQKFIANAFSIKDSDHDGLIVLSRFVDKLNNEKVALQITVPIGICALCGASLETMLPV